jgi:hypothetical protein
MLRAARDVTDALRRRWQAVFGRPPPEQLTADLLRRMIAARVQEEAFGTLDRATLKLLDGLARRDGSRTAERNVKIGTVLVRDYEAFGTLDRAKLKLLDGTKRRGSATQGSPKVAIRSMPQMNSTRFSVSWSASTQRATCDLRSNEIITDT